MSVHVCLPQHRFHTSDTELFIVSYHDAITLELLEYAELMSKIWSLRIGSYYMI